MDKTRRYLTGHKVETLPTFIKSISVNNIDDKEFGVEIRLINGQDEYIVSSIKASESNLDLLRYIYESNEVIEITKIYIGEYIIIKVLGLYAALIKINDYLWCDINSLDLEDEMED